MMPENKIIWKGCYEESCQKEMVGSEKSGIKNSQKQCADGMESVTDLIIGSPPFAENPKAPPLPPERTRETSDPKKHGAAGPQYINPQTKGNISNLPAGDLVISSPPYEGSLSASNSTDFMAKIANQPESNRYGRTINPERKVEDYGNSEGQLGQEQGETFWSAAKLIVEQCYQILKPGGHAIWVCKDFVRKGKWVTFSKDWSRLCESVGFKLVHWHKATLVKETNNKTLFGHTETKVKERKSFFRRLAESHGSPKIDEEDVLCMQRQGQRPLFPS